MSERGQDVASDDTWPFWLQKAFPTKELSLPMAWICHELYGHAIQHAYMADSVFLFVFVGFAIWD